MDLGDAHGSRLADSIALEGTVDVVADWQGVARNGDGGTRRTLGPTGSSKLVVSDVGTE